MSTTSRRGSRWMAVGALCVALCLAVSGLAQASLITFNFEGVVGFTPQSASLGIASGTPIRGFYTFESTTPDLVPGTGPNASVGRYVFNALTIQFLGNTYTTGAVATKFINVTNSVTIDSYSVDHIAVGSTPSLSGPPVNGLAPFAFQFNISGTGGNNLFDSDALPLEPPSLASPFGLSRPFSFAFVGGINNGVCGSSLCRANGEITSLTAVPLPGALLLFGSGLLGLMGISVGRRMMAKAA
jgi:hypothetical protein